MLFTLTRVQELMKPDPNLKPLPKKLIFRYPKSRECRHTASNLRREQLGPGSVITLTLNEASQFGLELAFMRLGLGPEFRVRVRV